MWHFRDQANQCTLPISTINGPANVSCVFVNSQLERNTVIGAEMNLRVTDRKVCVSGFPLELRHFAEEPFDRHRRQTAWAIGTTDSVRKLYVRKGIWRKLRCPIIPRRSTRSATPSMLRASPPVGPGEAESPASARAALASCDDPLKLF